MMRRSSAFFTAVAAAAATLGLTSPAEAAAHYRAEPAAAPMSDRLIVRDLIWKRSGTGFEAGKANSRPQVVCASFAKAAGTLRSFSIGGVPVSEEALAKCNRAAT
jgi:hypothetical protein